MIPARHTWFHVRFFRWYSNYRIRKNFSSVSVHGDIPDTSGKPLLVIANHFSWWDGFFILWLNNRHFHKRFHVMMLEEQLRRNMILNRTGAFSVNPGSRDVIRSLAYAREILTVSKESPLLLMYPQGQIQSMHTRQFRFEPGIDRIIAGLEGKINILMVVALVDYFSDQKPQLHFYLEAYPNDQTFSASRLEAAFNNLISKSIQDQCSLAGPKPVKPS